MVRFNTRKHKDINADFYGPYVNPALIREALQIIRKIFPFRTCEPFADKLCLYYDLGLCQGPCEGKISKEDYHRNIRSIKFILDGKKDDLYRNLRLEMETLSRCKDFEGAARCVIKSVPLGLCIQEPATLIILKKLNIQSFIGLWTAPARIECFDISTPMGHQAVGSMVSFLNGKPDKSNYRRFRIKTVRELMIFV